MRLRRHWVTEITSSFAVLLGLCLAALSQQTAPKPATAAASAAVEWPVTFLEKVTAGVTAVGAKVQAKLLIATLVNGTAVPAGAILSGEVLESQAKSATAPSRLAIRMNQVQWKNAAPFAVKLYLTHWYHPFRGIGNEQGPAQPYEHGQIGLRAPYPQEQPGRVTENPESPSGGLVSPQRLPMKNVEAISSSDGTVVLTSSKSNIKLDKAIIYVLGADDLSAR
jgi:hypothetical protein